MFRPQSLFQEFVRGGGIYKKGPYYTECREMTDGCWRQNVWCGVVYNSGEVWGHSSPENVRIFPPLGLHFVRFLKQIFGYTALYIIL
jgi:hypothetical protein